MFLKLSMSDLLKKSYLQNVACNNLASSMSFDYHN